MKTDYPFIDVFICKLQFSRLVDCLRKRGLIAFGYTSASDPDLA